MTSVLDFLTDHLGDFALGSAVILSVAMLAVRVLPQVAAKRTVATLGFACSAAWTLLVWIPLRSAAPVVPAIHIPATNATATTAHPDSHSPAVFNESSALALVLLLGGLVALCLLLLGYARLHWLLHGAAPASSRLQNIVTARTGQGTPPTVLVSGRSRHVFSCGLWRPTIILPAELSVGSGPEHLRAILLHEMAHIHGRDIWRQTLASWLAPMLYWNPLFHLLRRELNFASEVLADEVATQATSKQVVLRDFLLLAEGALAPMKLTATALPALGQPSQFHRRMTMLIDRTKSIQTRSSTTTKCLLASAMTLVLAMTTTAWGAQAQAKSHGPRYEAVFGIKSEQTLGSLVRDLCLADLYIHEVVFDKKSIWRIKISAAKKNIDVRSTIVKVVSKHKKSMISFHMPQLPKKVEAKQATPRLRFAFDDAPARKIIDAIAKISGANIIIDPKVSGKVTIHRKNVGWRKVLDEVAAAVGAKVTEPAPGILHMTLHVK